MNFLSRGREQLTRTNISRRISSDSVMNATTFIGNPLMAASRMARVPLLAVHDFPRLSEGDFQGSPASAPSLAGVNFGPLSKAMTMEFGIIGRSPVSKYVRMFAMWALTSGRWKPSNSPLSRDRATCGTVAKVGIFLAVHHEREETAAVLLITNRGDREAGHGKVPRPLRMGQ